MVSGGVAANATIRAAPRRGAAARHGLRLVAPPVRLCTDNAVMVAWAGIERLRLGLADDLDARATPALAAAASWPGRHELPPRLPRRQRRGLPQARAAGLAAAARCAQAAAVLRARHPCRHRALRPGRRPGARTGEAARGILRLLDDPAAALADYVALVRGDWALYPGSPALIRGAAAARRPLRRCELHPEDHATLRRMFARDAQVAVHLRDGYEALGGLPAAAARRRGLILIDPPYEAAGRVRPRRDRRCGPARPFPERRVRGLVPDQAPRAGARRSDAARGRGSATCSGRTVPARTARPGAAERQRAVVSTRRSASRRTPTRVLAALAGTASATARPARAIRARCGWADE